MSAPTSPASPPTSPHGSRDRPDPPAASPIGLAGQMAIAGAVLLVIVAWPFSVSIPGDLSVPAGLIGGVGGYRLGRWLTTHADR